MSCITFIAPASNMLECRGVRKSWVLYATLPWSKFKTRSLWNPSKYVGIPRRRCDAEIDQGIRIIISLYDDYSVYWGLRGAVAGDWMGRLIIYARDTGWAV
jgi:hypothetical protein